MAKWFIRTKFYTIFRKPMKSATANWGSYFTAVEGYTRIRVAPLIGMMGVGKGNAVIAKSLLCGSIRTSGS